MFPYSNLWVKNHLSSNLQMFKIAATLINKLTFVLVFHLHSNLEAVAFSIEISHFYEEKFLVKTFNSYGVLFQTIPESAFCTIQPTPPFLFEFSSLLFFIMPMTIMIFLYVRMGLRIRKTATFGKNTAVHGESKQAQSKKAILKMLGEKTAKFHRYTESDYVALTHPCMNKKMNSTYFGTPFMYS